MLCLFCLLSAVGCAKNEPAETTSVTTAAATEPAETQQETAAETEAETAAEASEDYLASISGTYVELFPELSKAEYREIWINATTPLVGAENAEGATDMLLAMCMADIYGAEAAEKYAAEPDSMAFDC